MSIIIIKKTFEDTTFKVIDFLAIIRSYKSCKSW